MKGFLKAVLCFKFIRVFNGRSLSGRGLDRIISYFAVTFLGFLSVICGFRGRWSVVPILCHHYSGHLRIAWIIGSIGLLAQLVVAADRSYCLPSFPYSLRFLIPNSQFSMTHLLIGFCTYSLFTLGVQGFHVSLVSTSWVGAGILWICRKILSRLLVREYHGVYFLRRCNLNRQQS